MSDEEMKDAHRNCTTSPVSRKTNPYTNASFLSRLFLTWPYELLKVGMKRTLVESDLPDIETIDTSAHNRKLMERIWEEEKNRCELLSLRKKTKIRPSLHWAILKNFLSSTWIIQPLMFASSVAKVIQAIALGYLIQSFVDKSNDGYYWAAILVFCSAIILFEHHHVFLIAWRKGAQLRVSSVATIFAKSLALKSIGGLETYGLSTGQIMNLVSNDVERFLITSLFLSYLFWAPLQAIAIFFVGLEVIGFSFAAGFGLLVLVFVPLQFYLSKKFAKLRSKVAKFTDNRVTLVSQAIEGCRVMKMSGWEMQFSKRIAKARFEEVEQIQKANRLKVVNEVLYFCTSIVVSTIIFIVYVHTGGHLTIRKVFEVMTLINIVQLELTKHVSLAVMAVSECWVSISRIQKFFELPELSYYDAKVHVPNSRISDPKAAIVLEKVCCDWNSDGSDSVQNIDECESPGCKRDSDNPLMAALTNINLNFKMNSLTCIIGSVGSGKSALLLALARELPVTKGNIYHKSTIAYASQDPWIMNGTLKENILMGLEYDEDFYIKVINSCGLSEDFDRFINGDLTTVGDRGVQCSGGQRARISLARALYRNSDVLLLDDPLSAVDSKVGRTIFYSAIQELAVGRGKCVILVTHQHQYIGKSRCILMSNSHCACIGTYQDCLEASNGNLKFVSNSTESTKTEDKKRAVEVINLDGDNESVPLLNIIKSKENNNDNLCKNAVDQEELNISGTVRNETFVQYMKAMGGVSVSLLILLLFTATQLIVVGSVIVFGKWSERDDQNSNRNLFLIISLAGLVVCLSYTRTRLFFIFSIQASKCLHDAMTNSVLRAAIVFFDSNPSGRILNRFSADVGVNDDLLPSTLFNFLDIAFTVIGAVITAVIVLPFTLILIPPLLLYFLRVRKIFVTTSRELKRLEGLARSPIFSMLNENLNGIATIRANDTLDYIKKKFEVAHDAHTMAFFSFLASSRWVGFRMDAIMLVNLAAASFLAVLFSEQGWFNIDPAVVGVAFSMLLQLGGVFQWCVRQSAEVVNLMVSVERVSQYTAIASEAPLERKTDNELKDWPKNGSILMNNVTVRYRQSLPPSLNNISFKITSGQRIGVVGRTGSGKSTLVQAIFRILEAEQGHIFVDDVDISLLGLHKLRMGISVINQQPFLFSCCTIRENLDPFQECSDDSVRDALVDVQMIDVVKNLPNGMNSIVVEGGANFSVGQRQLLCLARAMLRKSKILILDEPTANVDGRTDKLLQDAVSKSFEDATIISVAHRLDTVIESDKILVLGDGQVLEYGSPSDLLSTKDGYFYSMVNDTGEEMARHLTRIAMNCKNRF